MYNVRAEHYYDNMYSTLYSIDYRVVYMRHYYIIVLLYWKRHDQPSTHLYCALY